MSERFKMNRMGFVNFWLYGDESFDFSDGKMLLRGQNGSGKSITTQSFIPFILDGDRTPSRLDPFGSSDRRMEYYFLLDGEREEATGYLFLEFYKEKTGEYRTIAIGQRARKGKPMDFWGFVILDGRRIGIDLLLYKETGGRKIPYSKGEIKKILGEETPFTEQAREYKSFVNKYIFGFQKMEQYEQFIKLLIKVRAPKLSKEFKPSRVYDILNESLQTLSDEDLRPMVDAMEKMDAIQENLEQLKRAYSDVRTIRNEYIRYNQFVLAKKGEAYRHKNEERMGKTEEINLRVNEKNDKEKEKGEKEALLASKEDRSKLISTELNSLYDEDTLDLDRKLEAAKGAEEELNKEYNEWKEKIQKYKEEIRDKEIECEDVRGKLEINVDKLEREREELIEENRDLKWDSHSELLGLVDEKNLGGIDSLSQGLSEYKSILHKSIEASREYEEAERIYGEAYEETSKCEREKSAAEVKGEKLEKKLVDREDEIIQEFENKRKSNEEFVFSHMEMNQIQLILREYKSETEGFNIMGRMRSVYESKRSNLLEEQRILQGNIKDEKENLDDLVVELEEVQGAKELEYERSDFISKSRRRMEEAGIEFIPFYKAVEFEEGMEEMEKAKLEAALSGLGILDALIVPDGEMAKVSLLGKDVLDTILTPSKFGKSNFKKLVPGENLSSGLKDATVKVLSNIYGEEHGKENGEISIGKERLFSHGMILGCMDKEGEAEYVGRLARAKKKEKKIKEIEGKIEKNNLVLEGLREELSKIGKRLDTLDSEYNSLPKFDSLNELCKEFRNAQWILNRLEEQFKEKKKNLEKGEKVKNEKWQILLRISKDLPYERKTTAYTKALSYADEYMTTLHNLKESLMKIQQEELRISQITEYMENCESHMDDAFVHENKCVRKIKEQRILIEKYEEKLNQPEIRDLANRISELKKEKEEIDGEVKKLGERLALLNYELAQFTSKEAEMGEELNLLISQEKVLEKYFQEELELGLVIKREGRDLIKCAKEAESHLRDSDKNREYQELQSALSQVFQKFTGSLIAYGTSMVDCFEGSESVGGIRPMRSRVLISSVWNGQKLYLEEFYNILGDNIQATEALIEKEDRELFEEILSQTISRQLTERIDESRSWTAEMSRLMKNLDTSMKLSFSLEWKPRDGEDAAQMNTTELEKILLMNKNLLTQSDISRLAEHFRSKIKIAKTRQEDAGGGINYMELVRDALDYRNWFKFQMYYKKGEEVRKKLSDAAFNRFSGGEKAMAMYVPLFAAVNAQYEKAEKGDHPRIIALDEAFAGVDEKNISSMFDLVNTLDFDYIMNSQALWGCYKEVSSLRIVELYRPLNSKVVTPIRYTWNGQERMLDDQ